MDIKSFAMTEINTGMVGWEVCVSKTEINLFISFLRNCFVIKLTQPGILFLTSDLSKITKYCNSVTTAATILPQKKVMLL